MSRISAAPRWAGNTLPSGSTVSANPRERKKFPDSVRREFVETVTQKATGLAEGPGQFLRTGRMGEIAAAAAREQKLAAGVIVGFDHPRRCLGAWRAWIAAISPAGPAPTIQIPVFIFTIYDSSLTIGCLPATAK